MRMSQRSLALAFDCFAEAVSTIVAQRQRIAKAMGKWTMPGLIKVFEGLGGVRRRVLVREVGKVPPFCFQARFAAMAALRRVKLSKNNVPKMRRVTGVHGPEDVSEKP